MKLKFLSIAFVLGLISTNIRSEVPKVCPADVQKKLHRIAKTCKKSNEICRSVPKGAMCEDIVKHFSNEIQVHTERLERKLFEEDLTQDSTRVRIKKDIKQILKITKILGNEEDSKKIDKEIKPLYKLVSKFSKKDEEFLNKVHANGLTTKEIALRMLKYENKIRLINAVNLAFQRYKNNAQKPLAKNEKKIKFVQYIHEELIKDQTLASTFPLKQEIGRKVASVGLILFGCANGVEDIGDLGDEADVHLLLYGKRKCWGDTNEWVFGPGLYWGTHSKAAGYICLSGTESFKGIGVTSGVAGIVAGASAGVYLGTGLCVKAEVSFGALGAFAGLSYLEIDSGVNVFEEMINL